MQAIKTWWRARRVRRNPLDPTLWRATAASLPLVASLDPARLAELERLTTLFVHDKDFYGAGGLELDDTMMITIAAQACLPVLDLGWDWLTGWHSIFVYPGEFRSNREIRDEHGLAWIDERELAGEAHPEGGLVLSWTDVAEDIAAGCDGQNVVIHEIAHRLDLLNGDADGFPPLRRGMDRRAWTAAMRQAFDAMNAQLDQGRQPRLDPYAATEPAEFFAVMSEYYFETPDLLRAVYPAVFDQLHALYRGPASPPATGHRRSA